MNYILSKGRLYEEPAVQQEVLRSCTGLWSSQYLTPVGKRRTSMVERSPSSRTISRLRMHRSSSTAMGESVLYMHGTSCMSSATISCKKERFREFSSPYRKVESGRRAVKELWGKDGWVGDREPMFVWYKIPTVESRTISALRWLRNCGVPAE